MRFTETTSLRRTPAMGLPMYCVTRRYDDGRMAVWLIGAEMVTDLRASITPNGRATLYGLVGSPVTTLFGGGAGLVIGALLALAEQYGCGSSAFGETRRTWERRWATMPRHDRADLAPVGA